MDLARARRPGNAAGENELRGTVNDPSARRPPEGHAAKRTAASRVLSLLEAFSHGRGALTLTEISRDADLPLSTTHRLVREVMSWGGLEIDDQGRYRLSRKFVDLAAGSTRALHLRDSAMPHLIDLHNATGLTVHLAARDGDEVMYLEALRAHPNYTGQNRMGGRLSLHLTATGLVLLAYADPEVVDDFLTRPLRRFASGTPTRPEQVRALLEGVRRRRYALAERTVAEGAASVAAPIRGLDGTVPAAVGVTYNLARGGARELADMVRMTARRISEGLMPQDVRPDHRTITFNRRRAGLD